jgi:phytoene synthase
MTPKTSSTSSADTLRDPAAVLSGSTFATGLQLLPPTLRRDARSLYLLLRTIDDLVDEQHPAAKERVDALERWADGARPESPETETLAKLAERYTISRTAVREFCEGMSHDLKGATIETDEDLERYCHCVAGTVGILLAALLGATSDEGITKMAALGVAMQRTNILRDIDEDLEHQRIYIPRDAIEQFGFPSPGAREELLRAEIPRADALYEQGMGAIPLLRDGQLAMGLSAVLYREILRQLERDGFGRTAGRTVVPAWRKRIIAARYATKAPPHTGLRSGAMKRASGRM